MTTLHAASDWDRQPEDNFPSRGDPPIAVVDYLRDVEAEGVNVSLVAAVAFSGSLDIPAGPVIRILRRPTRLIGLFGFQRGVTLASRLQLGRPA